MPAKEPAVQAAAVAELEDQPQLQRAAGAGSRASGAGAGGGELDDHALWKRSAGAWFRLLVSEGAHNFTLKINGETKHARRPGTLKRTTCGCASGERAQSSSSTLRTVCPSPPAASCPPPPPRDMRASRCGRTGGSLLLRVSQSGPGLRRLGLRHLFADLLDVALVLRERADRGRVCFTGLSCFTYSRIGSVVPFSSRGERYNVNGLT